MPALGRGEGVLRVGQELETSREVLLLDREDAVLQADRALN